MVAEQIWQKIVELAIEFFNYAMTVGENRFMLVDADVFSGNGVSDEVQIYFIASFLIMTVIAIFASDSFQIFHPIEGLREWKSKIHILKVVIFAAAVFSLHTFYKMLVAVIANVFHDSLGSVMVNCLGTFINPISVCIMSIAVTTVEMRRKWFQAFFLGLSIFVTPAILSYAPFTKEYITIYVVGAAISLVAAILYRRLSMYSTYVVMAVAYFVGKYYLIANSEQAKIIDNNDTVRRIGQYVACIRIDIGIVLVLLLILLIYKMISEEKISRKRLLIQSIMVAVLAVLFGLSYPARILFPINPVVYAKDDYKTIFELYKEESQAESQEQDNAEINYVELPVEVINAYSSSCLVASSGNKYDIDYTIDNIQETCWQDGVDGDAIGETLTYEFDEALVDKITVVNGNRRDDKSYGTNNRISVATVHFYLNGDEVYTEDIEFEDNESITSEFVFSEGVLCNAIVIEVKEVFSGSQYQDTCVAEVGFTKLVEE